MNTFSLLDAGNCARLEQWGPYRLIRPDPTAFWPRQALLEWQKPDAVFRGTSVLNGTWETSKAIPQSWSVKMGLWSFAIGLSSSKHVGLFPEQMPQWQVLNTLIEENKVRFEEPIRFLNLFAYTGAASIVATKAGAFTTHVDSSSPAIGKAKENQLLNDLPSNSIRWIKEDVITFIQREIRRGKHYDIISLDPPAYGHGTKGEHFSLQKDLLLLLEAVRTLLSEKAIAVIVTIYSENLQGVDFGRACQTVFPSAITTIHPLELHMASTHTALTTGRWAKIMLR